MAHCHPFGHSVTRYFPQQYPQAYRSRYRRSILNYIGIANLRTYTEFHHNVYASPWSILDSLLQTM